MTTLSVSMVNIRSQDQIQLGILFGCPDCRATSFGSTDTIALSIFLKYLDYRHFSAEAADLRERISIIKNDLEKGTSYPISLKETPIPNWSVVVPEIDLHNNFARTFNLELCKMTAAEKNLSYQPIHFHQFLEGWMKALSQFEEAFTEPYTIDQDTLNLFSKNVYSKYSNAVYLQRIIQKHTDLPVKVSDPQKLESRLDNRCSLFWLTIGDQSKKLIAQNEHPVFFFSKD